MSDNPDMTLGVRFYVEAVENPAKSREAGRPIFEDMEFVEIGFPADNKRKLVAPAHEMHYVSHAKQQMTYAERFPAAYAAFKDEIADFVTGTPLSEVAFLTAAKKSELKALGVVTVEQLAGLPDASIRKIGMGAREMVDNAKAFLSKSASSSEVDELKRQLAELQAQLSGQKPENSDQFEGFERDDLFNMAQDAGLSPRSNATRESLVAMLSDAAKKKEAA